MRLVGRSTQGPVPLQSVGEPGQNSRSTRPGPATHGRTQDDPPTTGRKTENPTYCSHQNRGSPVLSGSSAEQVNRKVWTGGYRTRRFGSHRCYGSASAKAGRKGLERRG